MVTSWMLFLFRISFQYSVFFHYGHITRILPRMPHVWIGQLGLISTYRQANDAFSYTHLNAAARV